MMMDKVPQMNPNIDYHPCIANELKDLSQSSLFALWSAREMWYSL